MALGFQFRAQSLVIINLAIEDDYGIAIGRKQGLGAGGQVNYFQSCSG